MKQSPLRKSNCPPEGGDEMRPVASSARARARRVVMVISESLFRRRRQTSGLPSSVSGVRGARA